ncbi:MAG: hypothetical protein AAF293_13670 [Pseudomonadota bacterium]
MLDPVVITLSLLAALVCLAFYVAKNPEFRAYIKGGNDSEAAGDLHDTPANGDCR